MSGGSWDYLCYADIHAQNLWDKAGEVRQMADRLVALGYEAEAREMHNLAIRFNQARVELEARWESLQPVMKAVEWLDSGDYGPDNLRSDIEDRRVGAKVPA